jgi:zinc/manganese transport system substrate-binding protein
MRSILTPVRGVAVLGAAGLLAAACGSSGGGASAEGAADGGGGAGSDGERPTIVVTTTILGDIVQNVAGEEAEVEVLLPRGADPHEASLSARQAEDMTDADLLVTNGAGFEEGMASVIASVEDAGTPVFAFADHVDLLPAGEDDHDATGDPHVWTDPARMAAATAQLGERIAELDGLDVAVIEASTADYVAALEELDRELDDMLAPIPAQQRVLVTNHEVFGYFADRYDFEVVGAVIPAQSTLAEASPAGIEELADTIEREGVRAIFAESTQSTDLAEALADQVGDIEVVTLFTESLGDDGSGAETYVDMMRTNAQLVVEALG